jgi:hypothetical protein
MIQAGIPYPRRLVQHHVGVTPPVYPVDAVDATAQGNVVFVGLRVGGQKKWDGYYKLRDRYMEGSNTGTRKGRDKRAYFLRTGFCNDTFECVE